MRVIFSKSQCVNFQLCQSWVNFLNKLNKAEWGIYTSVNLAIIDSDNGLSPVWRQAIIWTNAGL